MKSLRVIVIKKVRKNSITESVVNTENSLLWGVFLAGQKGKAAGIPAAF